LRDLFDDSLPRRGAVAHLAGRFAGEAGGLAQARRDLCDLLRRVVGSEHGRLRRQIVVQRALRRALFHDQVLAGLGMRTVEDGRELEVIGLREAIQLGVQALLDVGLALRDLVGRDAR
jgi:hypothetical protein